MTFAGLLWFELRYQVRRVAPWAAALLAAGAAFAAVATGYGPPGVDLQSPYVVTQTLGLLSLLAPFVLTVTCAEAALRDAEHGMTELVFATPVGKPRWLAARFGGALLAGLAAFALADVVLMVAPGLVDVAADRAGPFRLAAHAWAFGAIVLPNVVLVAALLFAVATLTRSAVATYAAAVAMYGLYWVAAFLVDSPLMAGTAPPTREALARAALLDPFGLSAFFEQTRYWVVAERDVRPIRLEGRLLVNRLLCLGAGAGVLALAYARFAFRVADSGGASVGDDTSASPVPARQLARVEPAHGGRAVRHGLAESLRMELRLLLRGWTVPALVLLWTFVAGMEATGQLTGEYGSRALATTSLLLDAIQVPLLLLGTVALAYYTTEVAWRERTSGMDAILDATATPLAARLVAKVGTLALLALVLGLVGIATGIAVQLATGARALAPLTWLTMLWYGVAPLVLFVPAALAVHAAAGNRWVGLVGGLALAVLVLQGRSLGLEHPLLRFGATPSGVHSGMGGYGHLPASFAAFVACWAVGAVLLVVLGAGLWPRGPVAPFAARVRGLGRQLGPGGRRLALGAGGAFALALAGLSWLTLRAGWESRSNGRAWRADYERTWRRLHQEPQPVPVALRTLVRLSPDEGRAEIEGTYELENSTPAEIDTVWLAMPRGVAAAEAYGPDGARATARLGMHAVALPRPLAPGARTTVRFVLALDRGGIRAELATPDVVPNGSMLMSGSVLPSLGYRPGWELDDPAERREHGLEGEALARPTLDAADSLRAAGALPPWMTLETTIATAPDQVALAPGDLVRRWDSAGRAWYRYAPARPVGPAFAIASARYEVARVRHGDVDVEVWHHRGHDANVPRLLAAATGTLDVLGARLGPYPHRVLRIAEVPSWWRFGAYAAPTLVLFPEHRGFLADPREGDVDLVTRRVAHEVAHQWWGHALAPLDVAGSTVLVETPAKDAEALVIADLYGAGAVTPMLAYDEDRYFAGRASDPATEPPLMATTSEDHLYYGKGAMAMHALRERLGHDAVDAALAALLGAHAGPGGSATTRDLRAALLARARTAGDSGVVDTWLAARVTYEFQLDSAQVERAPDGWRVRAVLLASRMMPSGDPAPPAAMDSVEVSVLDGAPGVGRELARRVVPVRDGVIDLPVRGATRPVWLALDPRRLLLTGTRWDDAVRIGAGDGGRRR